MWVCEYMLLSIPLWIVYWQLLQSIWVPSCSSTRIVVSKKQIFSIVMAVVAVIVVTVVLVVVAVVD